MGSPTTWVHIFVDALDVLKEYLFDDQREADEVALMPTTLSTTVRHIYDKVPDMYD
jgi:hypothetical protein